MWKKFIYEGQETDYSVSTEGEVRKDSTNLILTQQTQQGYKFVGLTMGKVKKRMRVHRMVTLTFVPNPENKPYVNHINGERKTTNDYQWRYYDDIQDVGKVEKTFLTGKKVAQCDENGNILNIYPSFREAARAVDGTSSAISKVCSGTNIRHKGFRWKLVEEIVQEDI